MRDRIPAKPNRVLITPEGETAPYYAKVTRADEPTDEGTPLNKATFLSDDTAEELELFMDPVPSEAFSKLWDTTMRADGLARAIMLDANVNEAANRSSLGENTRYADTYGLGYALCFYGGVSSEDMDALSRCKNRREIANSPQALEVIGKYAKLKELWRAYNFNLLGRYKIREQYLGNVSESSNFTIKHNPLTGYLYAHSGDSAYVSTDNGASWTLMSSQVNNLVFSSDFRLVCSTYDLGRDNGDILRISHDGVEFDVNVTVSTKYGGIYLPLISVGDYYYFLVHIYPGSAYSNLQLARTSGMGGIDYVSEVMFRYQGVIGSWPVGDNVGVFGWRDEANDNAGTSYVGFLVVNSEGISTYKIQSAGNAMNNNAIYAQYDMDGNLFLKLRRDNTYAYYKVVAATGEVVQLPGASSDIPEGFPIRKDVNVGRQYIVPTGQSYELVLQENGSTVSDNFGEFYGTPILSGLPANGGRPEDYVSGNEIEYYECSSGAVYKKTYVFYDEEAQ